MKYAHPRTSFLALGIAALGLFATPQVKAGTAEIAALTQKLGKSIADATGGELATAVRAVINDPLLKKLNPAVVTAEALKGTTDINAGFIIGQDIVSNPPTRITDLNKFAALTAVSASTGKTANATFVPSFESVFVSSNDQAINLAKLALKSTTAIGAIIGGRGLDSDITNSDTALIGLATLAIDNPKLKKATQQISQYVSLSIDDAPAFALTVAGARLTLLQKIATGTAAGHPTEANAIVNTLLTAQVTSPTTLKNASKIAKSVGLVADPEQVAFIGVTFGAKISSKQVTTTARALIQAISGRATLKGTSNGIIDNQLSNKTDEIGEIASSFLAAVAQNSLTNAALTDPKKGSIFVFNLVKTMFKAAKVKTIKSINQKSTDLQTALMVTPGFFGASITYTLNVLLQQNKITQAVFDAIKTKLTSSSAAAIGGKNFKDQLIAQFNAGYAGTPASGFEDGVAGPVVDPETDTRNG